jgi:hypothetical protein
MKAHRGSTTERARALQGEVQVAARHAEKGDERPPTGFDLRSVPVHPPNGRPAIEVANRGAAHASEPLPFLEKIQRAFGRHEVGHSRVAIDGASAFAAGQLGANAFTIGDRIGFRAVPDLRLAAHEAAHVVQQRAGVALDAEVGAPADRFEANADAAAEAVVRGDSAVPILDRIVNGSSHRPCGCGGTCATCGSATVQLQAADEDKDEEQETPLKPFSSYSYGITEEQMCGGQKCKTDEEIYKFAAPEDPTLAKRASTMGVLERWKKCGGDCDGLTFDDMFYSGVQSGWFYQDEKEQLELELGRTERRKRRAKQEKADAQIAQEQAWEAQGEEMVNFANSPGLLGWYACEAAGKNFDTSMKCGEYVNAAVTAITIAKGGHSYLKNRRGPIASEGPNGFVVEDFEGPVPHDEARLGALLGEEGSLDRVRTRYGDNAVSTVARLAKENKLVARFIQQHGEAGVDALLAADGDLTAAKGQLPAYQLDAPSAPTVEQEAPAPKPAPKKPGIYIDGRLNKPAKATPTRYWWRNRLMPDGNFIDAELHDGVLSVTVKSDVRDDIRRSGSDLMDDVFKHFGEDNIKQFQGEWVRDSKYRANYDEYMRNLNTTTDGRPTTPDEAAKNTWTGRYLGDRGYTKVTVDVVGDNPNDPESVHPLFSK